MSKISDFLNYLIVLLVFGIAGAFFYFKNNPKVVAPKPLTAEQLSAKQQDEVVNKYLQETTQNVLREKIKGEQIMAEARLKLAELEKKNREKQQKENEKIPLEKQIWKESDLPVVDSPAQDINSKVNQKVFQDQMDEAEKKEYARQFIENARKGGYHIELDNNLEVIKVTPIRRPSQQDDSSGSYPSD